ncbi:MAG: DUF6364 family protein [Chitinophagales bacterium]
METKLTLSMDEVVIKKAKEFAKKNHTSLSQMIENYFSNLTKKERNNDKDEISPLVKSLSGVLQLPDNFDFKKDRIKYLDKKYK